ncbi:hypothetical protein [Saccharothrix texasensis]|uniref:Uncharacterized protein n=1 Tax=Saccharothrix texasensis TaxID=103734 RepID=A0A3N1GZL2_9PSEU|nr:hypothetical protein [Saccharothrix texasensis]ROP35740.1 hypothetical protein EDD40_0991 [Saccharothrix texasensis]
MAAEVDRFPSAVFGLDSGFFHLPAAQARAWGVGDREIEGLRDLLAIGHLHFAFHDLVIDEGHAPAAMCVIADTSLLVYLDGLAALSPDSGDRYRSLHDRYYRDYAAAIGRDLAHRDGSRPYTVEDVIGLGDKAAPGMTALHVVADLASVPERGEPTARALLRLCTGLQLLDDLQDAAEDAASGNTTWPLASALLAYPDVDVTDADDLRAALVGSGAARACLNVAEWAFGDAFAQAGAADAGVLAQLADVWRQRAVDQRAALLTPIGQR